jgi:hypothetical protein
MLGQVCEDDTPHSGVIEHRSDLYEETALLVLRGDEDRVCEHLFEVLLGCFVHVSA